MVFGQLSVVVVACPAVTVVVPVSVSRLKKPLQAPLPPLPGTQSLTAEFVLLLATVSVCNPTSAPVGLKALNGKDASREATPPLLQGAKLQLCWALPSVVKVPNGRSTWTVATPALSTRTQPRASGVPSRFASTSSAKPSCLIMSRLAVR